MGRKILFITTDQQRFDALGCNGGTVARTPVVDALARAGIRYTRANANNVVCMPARSTMLTGQYVRTHGVTMNGIPLPDSAPSVAQLLHQGGYHTALFGKAHFEPMLDLMKQYTETRLAGEGSTGPYRGFERVELASHTARGPLHYPVWMAQQHPQATQGFYRVLNAQLQVNEAGGGDTGACQVQFNPVPRALYHTDWVADRTIAYLQSLDVDADWFVWLSFPDPHHPWDPPQSELGRVNWRDVSLPAGYPGSTAACRNILDGKPTHWRKWFEGELVTNFEAPPKFIPAQMTADQIREINSMTHIENELIDEALGRVLATVNARGWDADTDIIYSTDHGEFQGDFGLLFKGPYHVDSLMRLPLIWRPAPSAKVAAAEIAQPVSQVDLAPTFLQIAGLPVPAVMQGQALPQSNDEAERQTRRSTLTEWDSDLYDVHLHLRTLYQGSDAQGFVVTRYEPGTLHDGSEGELYNLKEDPQQWVNLWDDPGKQALKQDLLAELSAKLPPEGPLLARVSTV